MRLMNFFSDSQTLPIPKRGPNFQCIAVENMAAERLNYFPDSEKNQAPTEKTAYKILSAKQLSRKSGKSAHGRRNRINGRSWRFCNRLHDVCSLDTPARSEPGFSRDGSYRFRRMQDNWTGIASGFSRRCTSVGRVENGRVWRCRTYRDSHQPGIPASRRRDFRSRCIQRVTGGRHFAGSASFGNRNRLQSARTLYQNRSCIDS